MSDITLETGQTLTGVHPESACAGRSCCIHNPSDHSMAGFPRLWRDDPGTRFMERLCPHGVGHPDPDDTDAPPVHGCCAENCCWPRSTAPVTVGWTE